MIYFALTDEILQRLLHLCLLGLLFKVQREFDQPKAYVTGKHSGGVNYYKLFYLAVEHYGVATGQWDNS